MKGDTVSGTWARRGCGPGAVSGMQRDTKHDQDQHSRFESYIVSLPVFQLCSFGDVGEVSRKCGGVEGRVSHGVAKSLINPPSSTLTNISHLSLGHREEVVGYFPRMRKELLNPKIHIYQRRRCRDQAWTQV